MPNNNELVYLSATELGERIASKEVSPVEAVDAYLERIERLNPRVNAYITVLADHARREARLCEQEISCGDWRGPLHGVPVAIKDQIHTRGFRTTDGSKLRADFIPDEDATVYAKLKSAGAILLGKLNLSEFALGDPVSSAFGPARNPWDLERNPGTSSAGSGAATAAFMCATSLGEDTGGSIRGPAAYCGLVGLRPTWGRVSRYGVDGACWSVDTIGPISRTVSDAAITIGAIAGHDPKDPYTRQISVPDYREALGSDLRGIKVGVVQEFLDSDTFRTQPQTRDAILAAAETLRELGAEVREVSLPLARHAGVVMRTISHVERVSIHPEWLRERPQEHHHNTRVAFSVANLIPAEVYYRANKARALIRQQVFDALKDVDVLLQPTAAGSAGKLNPGPTLRSKAQAMQELIEGGFRGVYSLAGVPALSILAGFTTEGPGALPLAIQIAGRRFDEATVLRVAHAYEQATPWHKRRPPI